MGWDAGHLFVSKLFRGPYISALYAIESEFAFGGVMCKGEF